MISCWIPCWVLLWLGCTGEPDKGEPDTEEPRETESAPSSGTAPGCDPPAEDPAWIDADHDGAPAATCDPALLLDCQDDDPDQHPGAPEVCDGQDNDCDGRIDDADDPIADGLSFYADADGDGYGADDALVRRCVLGEGLALADGDCDDSAPEIHPGADEGCDQVDQDCDGESADGIGSAAGCAVANCQEALLAGAEGDGSRWVRLNDGGAAPVWCDMTTDGGGWTLGFLHNSAAIGNQGDFGAGELDPDMLVSPDSASSSATPRLGWLDLNRLSYSELQLSAHRDGRTTYRSRSIPRSALRVAFGDDGYLLYGGETGYYWCGGDASYTDAGVGAVNNPDGAPADCKGHGSLGSGWDFSESSGANAGLTLCGADASSFLSGQWGYDWIAYGTPGGAQAIWVR